jgi:hypothetical protein
MEAVRGFPITRRSGERYGSYDQAVISKCQVSRLKKEYQPAVLATPKPAGF